MLGMNESLGVLLRDESGSSTSKPSGKTARKSAKSATAIADVPLTPGQKILEANLRAWRKEEAAKTGKPAFIVFGDSALTALVQACPTTLSELLQVSGFGPDKTERYGAAICAICRGEVAPVDGIAITKPEQKISPKVDRPAPMTERKAAPKVDSPAVFKRLRSSEPAEAFLNPDQQALELRLREWRKSESERMGLPQFFVLGTTALRSIVISRPKTLSQLREIAGMDREKLDKFGANILELCNV